MNRFTTAAALTCVTVMAAIASAQIATPSTSAPAPAPGITGSTSSSTAPGATSGASTVSPTSPAAGGLADPIFGPAPRIGGIRYGPYSDPVRDTTARRRDLRNGGANGTDRDATDGFDDLSQQRPRARDLQQRDPVGRQGSQFFDRFEDSSGRIVTEDRFDEPRRDFAGRRTIRVDEDRIDEDRVARDPSLAGEDALGRSRPLTEKSRERGGRDESFEVFGSDQPRLTDDARQGRTRDQTRQDGRSRAPTRTQDQRFVEGSRFTTGGGADSPSLFLLQRAGDEQFDARRPEESRLSPAARLGDGQQVMVIGTLIERPRPVQFAASVQQIARLRTGSGQTVLVDLGSGHHARALDLRPGDRLSIVGGADRIDNQLSVRATHVAHIVPIDRGEADAPSQRQ